METLQIQCLSNNFIEKIKEIENTVKHDIIAFLTHLSNVLGAPSKYVHYGMTSSDLIYTSQAILLRDSILLLKTKLYNLVNSFKKQAIKYKNTICIGRSHGIHAEPPSLGLKLLDIIVHLIDVVKI